jgi:hypothetical protein
MQTHRTLRIIVAATFAALLSLGIQAEAAAGKKNQRTTGRALGRFDRNHDLKIDGKEAERLRGLYSSLSSLDTDHNGQLSDSEIAAAKVEAPRRQRKSKGQK